MPWQSKSDKSGPIYDALTGQGMSKDKAARIAISKSGQSLVKKGKRKAKKKRGKRS